MKLIPRHNQIIGRIVIERPRSSVIRPDATKNTTKLVLVDAVGEGAAAKGIKVGDIIVPMHMAHFMLDGGSMFRPLVEEDKVGFFVTSVNPDDLHVQTENGTEYVPFDSEKAAKSLGGRFEEAVSGAPV